MFECSVPIGMLRAFGWPSGSISSGLPRDELRRALEIRRRAIDLSHGEIAMAAMPIQPRVVGIERDAARIDVDRFADPAEVREPPGVPDDRIGVRGRMLIGGARLAQLFLVTLARRRDERKLPSVSPRNEIACTPGGSARA